MKKERRERGPNQYDRVFCKYCGVKRRVLSGRWVRHQRLNSGMKAEVLADHLGVTISYLCRIEKGLRPMPLHLQQKLIEFLG